MKKVKGRELFYFRVPASTYVKVFCIGLFFMAVGWMLVDPNYFIMKMELHPEKYKIDKFIGFTMILFGFCGMLFILKCIFYRKMYVFFDDGILINTFFKKFINRNSILDISYEEFHVNSLLSRLRMIKIIYLDEIGNEKKIRIPSSRIDMSLIEAMKRTRIYAGISETNEGGSK